MGTIYYCASGPATAGGQHVNTEHVAELRTAGLRAFLLLISSDEKALSFSDSAPVKKFTADFSFQDDDIVVIPEGWPKILKYFASKRIRKIIHCQNPYYLFHSFDSISALEAHRFLEIIVCSGFTAQMIRQFGFTGTIHIVRPAIANFFLESENSPKKIQIAYMPRKRSIESEFVRGLFRSQYPIFNNVNWVRIENKTRLECAAILKESAVFASFSFLEGLGLPPLEAMASGCIVAGFHGLGGREYTTALNGFWVDEGDYFGFTQQVAEALKAAQTPAWKSSVLNESKKTTSVFSVESFRNDLLSTWRILLDNSLDDYRADKT